MPRKVIATQYLPTSRVAKILGTNRRTLHNWIKSGRLQSPEVDEKTGYFKWTLSDVSAAQHVLQEGQR
jgi:predicted site-specific integrase-resolvase